MKQKQASMKLTWVLVTCFSLTSNFVSSKDKSLVQIVQGNFPKACQVEKETHYFDKLVENTRYLIRYKVICPSRPIKYSYIESHIVRTMRQVLLITIGTHKIENIKTLIFNEPLDYKASKKWLSQMFAIPNLSADKVKSIDGISGATLTAKAIKNAVTKTIIQHNYISKLKK